MVTMAEEGLKGNKKGRPIWTFVKKTSLAVTVLGFIVTTVLVLDAYKFVTIRVSTILIKMMCIQLFAFCPPCCCSRENTIIRKRGEGLSFLRFGFRCEMETRIQLFLSLTISFSFAFFPLPPEKIHYNYKNHRHKPTRNNKLNNLITAPP